MPAVTVVTSLQSVKSRTSQHIHNVLSNKSELRVLSIDANGANDVDLLAEIGYKQELRRTYSTLQVFAIAFSIMGLLPSISTTLATGLMAGAGGLVWGWFAAGFFISCVGISMSILASAIPTSGGLYYWTNYYAPELIRVLLSFFIGLNNSLGLLGGFCSINYGFSTEVLAAVYIQKDGNFNMSNGMIYGVFAACCLLHILICSATSQHTAWLQSFSIYVNMFIIVLYIIALPIGASKHSGFNSALFVFGNFDNSRDWSIGWSFMLSWMPCIWTIGGFDSCVHMSEEAKNATRSVPIGIIASITVCWVLGWIICIVAAFCIKDGDINAVISTSSGQAQAQIIFDCLGKQWAVAFMALIAFAQYLMGASILTALSRQVWAFARDDGLPFIYGIIKVINPQLKVPLRATIFAGLFGLVFGLLILIGPTAANALFSLGVASNTIAWGMPVILVLLPSGASKFKPGYFSLGKIGNTIVHSITSLWVFYVIVMSMFPTDKAIEKNTMNYTVVLNGGIWIIAVIYFFVHGYKVFSGPKSNLDEDGGIIDITSIDGQIEQLSDSPIDEKKY